MKNSLRSNMKKVFLAIVALAAVSSAEAGGQNYVLHSPDRDNQLEIYIDSTIHFRVIQRKMIVLNKVTPSLYLEGSDVAGLNPKVLKASDRGFLKTHTPVVPVKSSEMEEMYKELLLTFEGGYALRFRAYNHGFAYRFETMLKEEVVVVDEDLDIEFAEDFTVYFPQEESLVSHYERVYSVSRISEISPGSFCSLPVLFKTGYSSYLLFTEADLYDYAGLFLERTEEGFGSKFPKHVLEALPEEGKNADRNQVITKTADYIANVQGSRTLPWRVFVLADHDAELLYCDLVWQLSSPLKLEDTDWIKPGLVAWDWWNALNIKGVDFSSGINNDTYMYYIDFAAEYGLDYIILDEGWSKTTTSIRECAEDINVQELVEYGRGKDVGIILWVLWNPLDRDLEEILDQYREWGVKGIKVDFMQRADQYMVNFYERVAREAAERKLMVDFHGAFKPSGLRRAYPNLINCEGLKGLENSKWERTVTPEHDVTLPFIRMVAGPVDFTPGAMDNAQEENFFPRFNRPMSQGTRCHQLAMYIVYESPLQMLADNPSNYYAEDECTRFIASMPTVWDHSIVLEASVADYIVMARQKGDRWYIGGMTDWTARSFEIELGFLPRGEYRIEIFEDGVNAEKWATDYRRRVETVKGGEKFMINMAKGGGWAAIIQPVITSGSGAPPP